MQQFAAKKIQSDVKNDVVILGRGKILLSKVIVFHSTVILCIYLPLHFQRSSKHNSDSLKC